jgi:flagellar basal-body rod modification protein FlgD
MSSTINPVGTLPPQAGAAATRGSATGNAAATLSSDFETFLRMLTVQVENQDPLNPVDSNDYATQLATFSSVEQQVLTNDLLGGIADQMGLESLQQASSWIGMEALARAPVRFDGTPVTIRPVVSPEADRAVLVVRDGSNDIVGSVELDPNADTFVWDGTGPNGNPLPAGNYRFDVESYEKDTLIGSELSAAFNRIEEVRREGGAILLRLSDGTELAAGQIDGLRASAL